MDRRAGRRTRPGVEPWLPFGALTGNVAEQTADPRSPLSLTRRLVALRRRTPALRHGGYRLLRADPQVYAFARDRVAVHLNLSARAARAGARGVVLLDSASERTGPVDGVTLAPWQVVVVDAGPGAG